MSNGCFVWRPWGGGSLRGLSQSSPFHHRTHTLILSRGIISPSRKVSVSYSFHSSCIEFSLTLNSSLPSFHLLSSCIFVVPSFYHIENTATPLHLLLHVSCYFHRFLSCLLSLLSIIFKHWLFPFSSSNVPHFSSSIP